MVDIIEFPEQDFLSLAWSIVARDFHLPPDHVQLSEREQAVLIEYLRHHSELKFDGFVTHQV